MFTGETTHAPQLEEVDIESPPNDHWGDYKELQSPYEAAVAAQKVTEPTGHGVHSDPDEVKEDFGRYAAKLYGVTPVRSISGDSWTANDYVLPAGTNRVRIAEYDPYRKDLVISNNTSGDVFLSPNPNPLTGFGSITLPAGKSLSLPCRHEVWAFTESDFTTASTEPTPSTEIVTVPAAGADWTLTVPAGEVWTLQAFRAQLTTDANVATRTINYVIERPTTFEDLLLVTAAVGQTASSTVVYQGAIGIGELGSVRNGGLFVMFPNGMKVEGGTRIRSITQNIQAGDQWSAIHFTIIREAASAASSAAGNPLGVVSVRYA